jgi:hypothetical protein
MDLQKLIDELSVANIPHVYLPTITYDTNTTTSPGRIKYLITQMEKAQTRRDNNMALYYAYVIGKVIEDETEYQTRKSCKRLLTGHYIKVIKRIACLFEHDRTPLLLTCKTFTFTNLAGMTVAQFKKILNAAEEASTNRILATFRPVGPRAIHI